MFDPIDTDEIKRKNLYETVADKIEQMMVDGSLRAGTKLPSEQVLADHFRVSRNVVREAYKTLRERGLIEVRNGEGATVKKPCPSMLNDILSRMLALETVDYKELYQLRSALEVTACKLFVQNITDEKLNKIQSIYTEMENCLDDREKWSQLDLDFHRYIVKATDNGIFYNFYKPIFAALRCVFMASWEVPGAKENGLKAHKALLEAFAAKDQSAAAEMMEKHLAESLNDINFTNRKEGI